MHFESGQDLKWKRGRDWANWKRLCQRNIKRVANCQPFGAGAGDTQI